MEERKSYYLLAGDSRGGILWRGEPLHDFWMWNGAFCEDEHGGSYVQTVKVSELKEAALRFWRDGWVPVRPVGESFLRRMEEALRSHQGLKRLGVRFPEGPFLKHPEPVPEECLSIEAREHLGL